MTTSAEPQPTPSFEGRRGWLRAVLIAAAVLAAGLGGFVIGQRTEQPESALPVLGIAPAYRLTDQLGEMVPSSRFEGKVRLVSFLFPYCTTMCPLIASHLTNFENFTLRPAGLADKVAIVSFNIAPEHTGVPQMRAFMSQYGWKPQDRHWEYLTGSPAEIRRVVKTGFSVWYKRVSLAEEAPSGPGPAMQQPEVANKLAAGAHADYDIVHNDVIELVDRQGRIRKVYDNADTVGASGLMTDIRSLIAGAG